MNRALALVAAASLVFAILIPPAIAAEQTHATFQRGDVFVAVSNGQVQWRLPDGTLNAVLDTGEGGYTTGMAFDDRGHLFVTGFSTHKIYEFDTAGQLVGTFAAFDGTTDCNPESLVFDAAGNLYVGQAGCSDDVMKLAPDGSLLARYNVAVEDRGSDWIDLEPDQCTLRYTSEGQRVLQYDVCGDAQLNDWGGGLTTSYALRMLPDDPFDPDLLVATTQNIRRMHLGGSTSGYDAGGEDCWFALNLDPDATSFWSADFCTSNVYRFDIASGAVISSFNTGTPSGTVYGVAVFAELSTGAVRDCSSEDVSGTYGEVLPGPGQRTTVRYDARFLGDESRDLFAAEARGIAEKVQERAEHSLHLYGTTGVPGQAGLGFELPDALRIEISCDLNFGPKEYLPPTDGFVGEPGVIQLRLESMQNQLGPAVVAGFPASDAWDSDGAYWKYLIDHEVFHTVQYEYRSLLGRAINLDLTLIESPAQLATDLFPETDNQSGTRYLGSVQRFAVDKPSIDIDEEGNPSMYDAASVLQYWGERFGPAAESDPEQRIADFLKVLIGEAGSQTRAYDDAVGGNALTTLRDYYLAHYGLRAANISPTENGTYAVVDAEASPAYWPLDPLAQLDLGSGSANAITQVESWAGDIYEVTNIPAGATHLALRLDTGFSGLLNRGWASAIVPINRVNLVDEFVIDPELLVAGPNVFRPVEQRIPVVGRDRVAIIFANGNTEPINFHLSAQAVSGEVAMQFVDATGNDPHRIESATAEPILLEVVPTLDGQPAPGDLPRSAFHVQIGAYNASVGTADYRDGVYHLTVWAPSSLDAGTYPMTLTFADVDFAVPGGLVIEQDAPPPDQTIRGGGFGILGQGQSASTQATVTPGARTATFDAIWTGSDFDLTLTAPSGRIIGEDSTDPDVTIVQTPTSVSIAVADPEAGQWQLEVLGVDVPASEPVDYEVTETGAPLYGELFLGDSGQAGLPLNATFAWSEPDGAIVDGEVAATVTDPTGTSRRFPLVDDGGHGDVGNADGVYADRLWATDEPGTYEVVVTASGTTVGGAAVQRQATASVTLGPKVDTDEDGVADGAESLFELDPADPTDGSTDHDGDGLGLAAELSAGTDPASWDTDRGGESDPSELAAGRDPRDPADEAFVPSALIGARAEDGRMVTVDAQTDDGSGSIRLYRLTTGGRLDLGLYPGSGVTISDGPLPLGDHSYLAVAISAAGAESGPFVAGPVSVGDDVTRPDFRIHLNGDRWEVTDPEVSVTFTDLTEAVVDMRLATSDSELATRPWVPFSGFTSITVPPDPGPHFVYAQVRDAAGNESRVGSGFVLMADTTPGPPVTTRVSESNGHGQGNGNSNDSYISADGRLVTFVSDATDLVAGDTNGYADIFVHDRLTETTSRVSVSAGGAQANQRSQDPAISADGAYVIFPSYASNLISGDTNAKRDIFVVTLASGAVERVSVGLNGAQPDHSSSDPVISADGRYVAYRTDASNLVAGDTNGIDDIFWYDRVTGTTLRVSVASDGSQANDESTQPAISGDGRYVVFSSDADNLVAGDSNGVRDIFVHDTQTGTTSRLSVAAGGAQANDASDDPAISGDGALVAFESDATNLIANDSNGKQDVFVVILATGAVERVSVDSSGVPGNHTSREPSLSSDGRYVAFDSSASNLVAGDSNGKLDVFVHDRVTGQTTLFSVALDSQLPGNHQSLNPCISGDGSTVAFESDASDLVADDTNGSRDVFVRGPAP